MTVRRVNMINKYEYAYLALGISPVMLAHTYILLYLLTRVISLSALQFMGVSKLPLDLFRPQAIKTILICRGESIDAWLLGEQLSKAFEATTYNDKCYDTRIDNVCVATSLNN